MNPNYQINPRGFIKLKKHWVVRLDGHWRNKYTKGHVLQADKEKKNFSNDSDFDASYVISLSLYQHEPQITLTLNNMDQKINQLLITPEDSTHGQLLYILQAKGLNPMRWGPALKEINNQTKHFLVDYDNTLPDLNPLLLKQICNELSVTDLRTESEIAHLLAVHLNCFFYRAAYCTEIVWDFNPSKRIIWNPTQCSFQEFKNSVPDDKELFLSYTEERVASIEDATQYILNLLEKSPTPPAWL